LLPLGDFDYTPNPGFSGTDSFTYVANDGTTDSNVATVTITVLNQAPVAVDDSYSVDENDTLIVAPPGVLLNDTDPEGDLLSASLVSDVANGTLSLRPLGDFDYTPNPGFSGTDSFTYVVNDGTSDSNVATITITVNQVNDNPPTANDESYVTNEDAQLVRAAPGVLSNDTDLDNDPLTAVLISDVSHGTLNLNSDGSFNYIPDPDYFGIDSFTYTAYDGLHTSNVATVTITLNPIKDAPRLDNPGPQYNSEGDSVTLDITFTDPDSSSFTYSASGLPPGLTLDTVTGRIQGTLTYESAGTYSITWSVSDGYYLASAVFPWEVTNTNRAPVADDQAVATDEDTAVAITLTASDLDGDSLTYAVVTGPTNGTLSGTEPDLTYTPNADYNGSDSFTFSASDGNGGSDNGSVSITVSGANDAPTADDQNVATPEDTPLDITLTASDIDGDTLSYDVAAGPSNGSLSGTAPNLTYTPNPDYNGPDSFTFTANDGTVDSNTATVSISVSAANDAPAVTNPGTQNSTEGDTVSLPISASDVDGDTLSYSAAGLPAGLSIDSETGLISGSLTFDSADSYGVTVTVSDGTAATDVVFSWNVSDVLRMHGDSITTGMYVSKGKSFYTADILVLNDGGAPVSGASVTANWAGKGVDTAASTKTTNSSGIAAFVTNGIKKPGELYTITIDDVVKSGYLYDEIGSATSGQYPPAAQNPPVAHDDNYSADEGAGLNVPAPGLLGNDTDAESDPLTAVLAGGPSHGSLNLNSDGSFSYTHDGSETTSDSFTYRANDGTVDSNTATVTITINPVNDAPTAVDDSASTQQDTPVVVDVLANDTDPEGDGLSISAVTQGTNGSVTNNGSDITYTPDPGFTGDDSFSYTADDGNGGTDTATVTVTVFSQNDPPTAVDDSASTDEDAAVVIDVLANDSDPDSDPLSVSAVTQGANGSVVNNGSDVTYTPDPDYHGPDSFTYTADDGNGGTDTATVSVTVLPVNDAPVAANDSASTPEDTAVVIDVLANDSDADGDTLTVLSTTQGANGTVVNNSGNVTYTPDPGYTGPDSFTYTADDGNGGTDTATVSVTVTASNSPLVADAGPDQSGTRREDLTFDGSNSNDPGGSITSWSWDFGDGKSGSGEIVEHDYKKAGTYTVTLTVTDDQGATDTDTATVTIN
jgi:VCBS repeat-containing protein